MNYPQRTGRKRHQFGLIRLEGITSSGQAAAHIGRQVILVYNEKTKLTGKVVDVHGSRGILRVRFRRGLAPEGLAREVKVF